MALGVLTLPVSPELKLTDRWIWTPGIRWRSLAFAVTTW